MASLGYNELLKGTYYKIQSTPIISCQLGAKICEQLSGSPVKAQIRDLQDHSPTLWRLHL